MKKVTLWAVDQSIWGTDKLRRRHFGTRDEANEFAKRDYTGEPVKITCSAKQAEDLLLADAAEQTMREV